MGLFNKIKNVLFEEEEVEEEVTPVENNRKEVFSEPVQEQNEYRPLPEKNVDVKPKEPTFEKVEDDDFSERELFKSDSTFKFPQFDEDEFNTSMPKLKIDEPKKDIFEDYESKRKQERRNEYSRLDALKPKEEVKEEKKRFKPSPVISPVYGILDKDYKAEDIMEAPKDANNNIISSKDLDVDSVRAKAFGKLEKDNLEKAVRKAVTSKETYEVKKEEVKAPKKEEVKVPEKEEVKESLLDEDTIIISDEPILENPHTLREERSKTIDELLKDASDEVFDFDDDIKEEPSIDDAIEDVIDEENEKQKSLENDTLENDLYDLIDSMYDNTEEGE